MAPGLSRAQIAVLAAVGIALLLLGAGALRDPGGSADRDAVRLAEDPVAAGAGSAGAGDVVVHVAGAVREPGVYRLPAGARVTDAIRRAGGPARAAAPDGLNLAARLSDGQQVAVPGGRAASGPPGTEAADAPISLSSADAVDLEQIEGIGPVTAAKIIAFRDERGGLGAIEELDAVPGIGPATLETLSDRLQP